MRKILCLVFACLLFAQNAFATTVTFQVGVSSYTGEKDALLINFSTNEHIEQVNQKLTASYYSHLYFDLSGASIPSNATVTSATLTIWINSTNNAGGNVRASYLTDPNSLGGGTVFTWCGSACDTFNSHSTYAQKKHEATQIHWNNASANVTGVMTTISTSSTLAQNYTGTLAFDVTTICGTWVATPASNLGFVMTNGSADPNANYDSYLGGTSGHRPLLSITYTLPSAGGAAGATAILF